MTHLHFIGKTTLALCFAVAAAVSLTTSQAHAMNHGDHGMMGGMGMKPMVEMPSNMTKGDFPAGTVKMMMTPDGEKAFVPWYLTKNFQAMLNMDKGAMAEGVMMQMDSGRFAFVPWYLAPQFSMTMTKKMGMMRGMKMMDEDNMSYMFVPWYKQ